MYSHIKFYINFDVQFNVFNIIYFTTYEFSAAHYFIVIRSPPQVITPTCKGT